MVITELIKPNSFQLKLAYYLVKSPKTNNKSNNSNVFHILWHLKIISIELNRLKFKSIKLINIYWIKIHYMNQLNYN